jgi:CspA family cold shock protein
MTVSFFNGESVVMSDSDSSTLKGVVKWFNDAKGFGFIEHSSGRDVFVHYSVITADGFKTLKDGEAVEYELKEGPKGLQAAKVTRTKKDEESSDAEASESLSEGSSSESAEISE